MSESIDSESGPSHRYVKLCLITWDVGYKRLCFHCGSLMQFNPATEPLNAADVVLGTKVDRPAVVLALDRVVVLWRTREKPKDGIVQVQPL